MNYKKKPSIKDIADAAGVSIATVSRVLNKSSNVRRETAYRVLEAADEMDYRPNRVARRMRVKSSDSLMIALVLTDIGNPFFSELARGVESIAYENKHAIITCNTDEDPEKERFYIHSVLAEKVSGLIIAPTPGNIDLLKELKTRDYPVVCVDRYPEKLNIDSVTVNNGQGAYEAVKRLTDLGHTRIAIVNGIEGLSTTKDRFKGYEKAMEEAGLVISDELILYQNYKESGGRKAIRQLLSLEEPATAIFATNNLMTLGCYEEMHVRGVHVPGDMAIIGFDDMPWAVALNPPLTAVKQPSYEMGIHAAELLLKRLGNPRGNSVQIVLNPELIVRDSCGDRIYAG